MCRGSDSQARPAVLQRGSCLSGHTLGRDTIVLLTPAVVLLLIVSGNTELNIHFRYALPCLAFFLVFLGKAAAPLMRCRTLSGVTYSSLLVYSVASSFIACPHFLAYFNAFAGGTSNGHKHLLGSSLDWGQDLLVAERICGTLGDFTLPLLDVQHTLPALGDRSRFITPSELPELVHTCPDCTVAVFASPNRMLSPIAASDAPDPGLGMQRRVLAVPHAVAWLQPHFICRAGTALCYSLSARELARLRELHPWFFQ